MAQAMDFLRILRPANCLMTAWAVLIGVGSVTPLNGATPVDWPAALLAMASGALLTGFGNVANDLADRDVDRTAHPQRPLPSGRMSVGMAAAYAFLLANVGVLLALLAGGASLLGFALGNAMLLLAYAAFLRRLPLVGNLAVAALVASAFLFGALAAFEPGWSVRWWGALVGFAVMAGLATLARENAKGLEDRVHDADRWTLARLSPLAARLVVVAGVAAACLLAVWVVAPVATPWWLLPPRAWEGTGPFWSRLGLDAGLWPYGLVLSIAPFTVGAVLVWRDAARAQRWLKAGMLVAMLGFSWGALLSWQSW